MADISHLEWAQHIDRDRVVCCLENYFSLRISVPNFNVIFSRACHEDSPQLLCPAPCPGRVT